MKSSEPDKKKHELHAPEDGGTDVTSEKAGHSVVHTSADWDISGRVSHHESTHTKKQTSS